MIFRSATETDIDDILQSSLVANPDRFTHMLESGNYRYSHTWLAIDGGSIVGLAVWWSFPTSPHPLVLSYFDAHDFIVEPEGLLQRLISAAHQHFAMLGMTQLPEHHVFLDSDWRENDETLHDLARRERILSTVGVTNKLERIQYLWNAQSGVPKAPNRLTFKPGTTEEFLELFELVSYGSLDDSTRKSVAQHGPAGQAKETFEIYDSMPGDRDWWRIAYDTDGTRIGFAMPSANNSGPVVGYLAVVPEHRGLGYGDELLAEITRFLADNGADTIQSTVDVGNVPMVNTHIRGGYKNDGVRIVYGAEPTASSPQ